MHVVPASHSPAHTGWKLYAPQGRSAPVQPQTPPASGTHSRAFAQPPKQVPPDPPQSGTPSVVVVYVGHDPDVVVVDVDTVSDVVDVDAGHVVVEL
jgi:hypothetical protein